jgi:hypothetical protein
MEIMQSYFCTLENKNIRYVGLSAQIRALFLIDQACNVAGSEPVVDIDNRDPGRT